MNWQKDPLKALAEDALEKGGYTRGYIEFCSEYGVRQPARNMVEVLGRRIRVPWLRNEAAGLFLFVDRRTRPGSWRLCRQAVS